MESKDDRDALLIFPTDYPIKVVGSQHKDLRARLDDIVRQHAPDFDAALVTERVSENARYVSISYMIRATSREQVIALANALKESDGVIMLI